MSSIAIIPARGGSKRIPRKNIKNFLGKPIMAYSIEAALESQLFDEVMVSTDDEEIAFIAKSYGASVPFLRSEKNADDYATTMDVIDEVISCYKASNIHFEYACCIYPTAPLLKSYRLNDAFELLQDYRYDCVFPVLPFSFPIQRSLRLNNENMIDFFNSEEEYLKRSQDFEKSYHDAGQFYFFEIQNILKRGKILTKNSGALVIEETEGQDIDTELDWKIAELKYNLFYNLNQTK